MSNTGQIAIVSNDPSSPRLVNLTGEVPPAFGELQVVWNGSPVSPESSLTSVLELGQGWIYIILRNVGDSDLVVSDIRLENETGPSWQLNNLPSLPLTLSPGNETDAVEVQTVVSPAPPSGDDGPSADFVIESTDADSPRAVRINTFELFT